MRIGRCGSGDTVKRQDPLQTPPRPRRSVALRYATLGTELGFSIVGLTLLGYWVDWHFGTGRAGVIVGASLGIVGGLYNFIRQAIALTREQQQEQAAQRHGDSDDPTRPAK